MLGYYILPERNPGDNEPILGPERAQAIKAELMSQEIDVFAVKHQLAELIGKDEVGEDTLDSDTLGNTGTKKHREA